MASYGGDGAVEAGQSSQASDGTISTAHDDLPRRPFDDLSPRYSLGDEIARGGGGRVVAAEDRRLGRRVAIKLSLEEPESSIRLRREAELLARLEHPSIVSVHDLGHTDDGTPFYVMRLLDGETLKSRIAARSFEERIALLPTMIAIVDAVAYAHHRGIVHRDLKPSNVIVGAFGETSVIDWGLARPVDASGTPAGHAAAGDDESLTRSGAVIGTPTYMAPEQAAGQRIDARADVYGLGAVLYHLLGGEPPYRGASSDDIVRKVIAGPPTPIAQVEPRVPADLAAIVAKAMARRCEDRYATAQELGSDLRRYQAGRLVAAHRYSVPARLRRWVRRHRAQVAAAAAVGAAAAVLVWQWPSGGPDARALCAASGTRALELWPPTKRAAVSEQIRSRGGPGAEVAARTIDRQLDGYVRALSNERVETCEATYVRGEQSAELLDLRKTCLDRRADAFRATVGLFDAIAPGEIEHLMRAVATLPQLAPCRDVVELRQTVPPPDSLADRARIAVLQGDEATAEALRQAGRYSDSLTRSEQVLRDPTAAQFAPLAASAGYNRGAALAALGRTANALTALHGALSDAELGHDDRTRGLIVLEVARAIVATQPDQARQLAEQTGAIARRTHNPELDVLHLTLLARIAGDHGDLAEAVALHRTAIERWRSASPDHGEDLVLAELLSGLGSGLIDSRKLDEAESVQQQAVALYEKLLGPDHPMVARVRARLANIFVLTNRGDLAIDTYTRALDILRRAGMAETGDALSMENSFALALTNLGHHDDARTRFMHLLERVETSLGSSHPLNALVLYNLGNNEMQLNHTDQALAWFRKALAWREEHSGPRHIETANARWGIAQVLLDSHRPAEALPLILAALPVHLEQRGETSEDVAYARYSLARAYVDLGRPREAVQPAEQCQDYFRNDPHLDERGMVRLLLAQALFGAGRDRARVVELATSARADFVASKIAPEKVVEADALLASARRR
jgi:tetratricopeptide (TPR) repeat protein